MIEKILFGLSSVLVVEGLILAIVPGRIKNVLKAVEKASTSKLSLLGLVMMFLGIVFLAMIDI